MTMKIIFQSIMKPAHHQPLIILLLLIFISQGNIAWSADKYSKARAAMLQAISADVRDTSSYLESSTLNQRVFDALARVPRHEFVPFTQRPWAYENRPLPIGYGQTISQPYIVAIMTDLLKLDKDDKVLEIGTGSGYQAAILGELVHMVYTIEIIEPLGQKAAKRLKKLGYKNIRTQIGDGYYGMPEKAPFDAIVVTAAASHIPPPLVGQLKPGGRMIIPVGSRFMIQQLILVSKTLEGKINTRQLLPVRFVPLTGDHPSK